jgi:hypothetical protein
VGTFELLVGPGIKPKGSVTPRLRLRHRHKRGISRRLGPSRRLPVIKRLADRGNKGKPEETEKLPA